MLPRKRGGSDGEFIRCVLIVVGIAALAAALYKLSDVVLLIFGAILVGVVIRALARPIQRGTSMSERLALLASGCGIAALLVGIGYLFGEQISDQLSSLTASLPQAAQRLSQTAPC
jgi:predicted PurR-regulated permease PerM